MKPKETFHPEIVFIFSLGSGQGRMPSEGLSVSIGLQEFHTSSGTLSCFLPFLSLVYYATNILLNVIL